jgi:hypothetical protein
MAQVLTKTERREFSRIALHRPALIEVAGQATACELLDISLRGALIQAPPAFGAAVGAPCTLTIRLDHGAVTIRMEGTIAHRDSYCVGVRSRVVDLDSATHLRRVLELNLGDERLLERELTALIANRG